MSVDWYRLEQRDFIVSSIFPQRTFDKTIKGLDVRFDVSKAEDLLEQTGSQAVVYNGVYIPIPKNKGDVNVHFNGKYGVGYDFDGFVVLGIKRDES